VPTVGLPGRPNLMSTYVFVAKVGQYIIEKGVRDGVLNLLQQNFAPMFVIHRINIHLSWSQGTPECHN